MSSCQEVSQCAVSASAKLTLKVFLHVIVINAPAADQIRFRLLPSSLSSQAHPESNHHHESKQFHIGRDDGFGACE